MVELARMAAAHRSFCTFRADGRLYGVDLAHVREVSTQTAVTPVPQAPPLVRGLVNLRSRIYLALDVHAGLGLPPAETSDESRLIVLHPRLGETLALFVERGGDTVRLTPEQIEEVEAGDAERGGAAPPVVAVGKLDAELLMIVDPRRLIDTLEQEIG